MKTPISVVGVSVGVAMAMASSSLLASEVEDACMSPDQETRSLSIVNPPYPYSAALFCVEGYATYEFTIKPDGTTSGITAVKSEPEGAFEAAGDVIRFWTFEPRCRDGEPVERKATQTIEFRLDQIASRNCPEDRPEEFLETQIALLSLYQQAEAAITNQHAPLTPMAVESALEEPFASIERAHRRHLNDRLALERAWRRYPLSVLKRAITPASLVDENAFSSIRKVLDIFETGRHDLYWKWPELVHELRRELVEVSEMPGVTPEVYEHLLAGDLRQPEGGITPNHEVMALEASVFSAHRELLDWLELHSHEWEVVDNELRFASDGLAQVHQRRLAEIEALRKTWDREFGTPRRIYWSGF